MLQRRGLCHIGLLLALCLDVRWAQEVPPGMELSAAEILVLNGIEDLAMRANDTCMQNFMCCYGSSATLSEITWQHVKSWHQKYYQRELLDSTPRMLERHYTFYNLYERMAKTATTQVWAADCYHGVVGIMLNALPAIEFEQGLGTAQGVFELAKDMLKNNDKPVEANWTLNTEPLELQFPFFLGLTTNQCHGSKLKLYVYETAEYIAGSLFCSAGQWGVEAALHRYFASSSCRTYDPEEADLFLVPDYRSCHYHLAPTYRQAGLTRVEGDDYHSSLIRNHKDKYRNASNADQYFIRLVTNLPYINRKKGMDHIFIFADQGFIVNFTHTFPSWREYIPHSIFMTTEAFTPGCGPSCFNPWKDIVIPGHMDVERMKVIRSYNKPSSERNLLFNFHGRLPVNHDYYENVTVRRSILQFAELPGVSIGGFVEDYFDVMGSSHFCLIPEGTSTWTNHLYESFFAGCIPLILSDRYVLPFQDLIDWPSVSIKWPQDDVDQRLYLYVIELVTKHRDALAAMKQRVDEHACWFDFYRFEGPCSPYRGVLHELEKRKQYLPGYLHPEHWMH